MKWRLVLPTELNGWLSSLPGESAEALLKALKAITKEANGPKELDMPEVEIRVVPEEVPALYRMKILMVEPNIGVLYGLRGSMIVVGAWGDLQKLLLQATIKEAQDLIGQFSEVEHGKL
jgi:hypothetical protein